MYQRMISELQAENEVIRQRTEELKAENQRKREEITRNQNKN